MIGRVALGMTQQSQMLPVNSGTPAGIKPFQIIYLAFMSGIMMFVMVTLALGLSPMKPGVTPDPNQARIMLLVLLAYGLFAASAGTFLWFHFAKQAGRQWQSRLDDESGAAAMLKLFGTRSIIIGALAEGVGLFAAVVLFLHRTPYAHIGIALSILTLAVLFPTRQKLQDFVRLAANSTGKDL